MAAILSRSHCVFVFVFDELYLYLYLIRFLPVYLYLYLYLKLRKKMYLYLYLIKRIWPQPWPLVPCQLALTFLRYSIFKVWPWKSKIKVIAKGHKEGIPPYRFISFSFHVNRPSHSWDTAILKFDIENSRSRSRSWVRSKFKVTTWVQHSVDSHPFGSMSIGPPIPEIQHFQSLTLKIQGQGHGSRSQRKYTTLSIHILFVPCQSALPFLGYSYFKIWHWKFKVKVMGQSLNSQHGSNIQSTHIPFVPCQSGIQFLSYDFSKIWPWKSRVKVMGEVKVESHNMGPTFSQLTSLSFHVDRASHSWVTTFSKFDLENQGSRSWVGSQFKVTMWV